mgnify:CR=1 FL=1
MRMPAFLPALLLALFASLVLSTRALHAQDISVGDIEPDLQVGMSLAAADEPIDFEAWNELARRAKSALAAGRASDSAFETLRRELAEELRLQVSFSDLRYVGEAEAPAANAPDTLVPAEIFEAAQCGPIAIAAEIAGAAWVDPDRPAGIELAPLTRDHILPLIEQGHGMHLS